jgi:pimeloyl-ACP methyl ester carboxylesterase
MGGTIAQLIAQEHPQLVRRMILAGTGPAGGEGIDKVTRISYLDTARGVLTRQDPSSTPQTSTPPASPRSSSASRWIIREVEDSLRRFDTDWIDLNQIHRWDPETDLDETLGALSDLVHRARSATSALDLPRLGHRRGPMDRPAPQPRALRHRAADLLDPHPRHRKRRPPPCQRLDPGERSGQAGWPDGYETSSWLLSAGATRSVP